MNSERSGLRRSSSIAPNRQNQFSTSCWPLSSISIGGVAVPGRVIAVVQRGRKDGGRPRRQARADSLLGQDECDQLDEAMIAVRHGLFAITGAGGAGPPLQRDGGEGDRARGSCRDRHWQPQPAAALTRRP